MYTYRIHIRPGGGTTDMKMTFDYCFRNGLLGVGWKTKTNINTKNWDDYYNEASQIYSNLNICKYINKWVKPGDLVWTRDVDGQYYLGRVLSGWEYWISQEAIDNEIDIANIFRVDMKPVDIAKVPGKVVACFRPNRAIQAINDKRAHEYTKFLWNNLEGNDIYKVDKSDFSDIFMMFDDEETEDLVFLYLQTTGWYVVPNSRKADTMRFEYMLVNPNDKQIALSQVKTGNTPINQNDYYNYPHKVFLFQSNEKYTGSISNNVTCITRDDLQSFINKSYDWLPEKFKIKINLVS